MNHSLEVPVRFTFRVFLRAVYPEILNKRYGLLVTNMLLWLVGMIALQLDTHELSIRWAAFVFPMFILVVALALAYFDVRRKWSNVPILADATKYTVTTEGLTLASSSDVVCYNWTLFSGFIANREFLMLTLENNCYLVFGTTNIPELQFDDLKEAIHQHLSQDKLKNRKRTNNRRWVTSYALIIALIIIMRMFFHH